MTDWQQLEQQYFMHTVNRVPVTLVEGEEATGPAQRVDKGHSPEILEGDPNDGQ